MIEEWAPVEKDLANEDKKGKNKGRNTKNVMYDPDGSNSNDDVDEPNLQFGASDKAAKLKKSKEDEQK